MSELKNIFAGSRMNKDLDSRLLPKGEYRDALNFRISKSESSDAGAGENSLSNRRLTNLDLGTRPKTLGMYADEFEEKIYWFVKSDSGSFILEWNNNSEISSFVLADTREDNVLNFNEDFLITGVNVLVDSDNGNRYLLWTDGFNNPRYINIERAKTYGVNGFEEDDLTTYKKPPPAPPEISLTDTSSDEETNLEEKFLSFAYRWQYLDGEYSALSPFTPYAFRPKAFNYDFSIASNESMVNRFSAVNITFNTGSKRVKAIEVVFKESQSNNVNVIESFDKVDKGWLDDTEVQFVYSNSKIKRVLPSDELNRIYDNVPLKALAQDLLGNRLMYADYTENINLENCEGEPLKVSLEADILNTPVISGTATETLKSIRDYEVGIAYMYEGSRSTPPLTSQGNTVYVPVGDSVNKNQLRVNINNLAPCKAEKYRFYVKQSKTDYDTIIPTLFYQDGVYVWIKLEGDEVDKINEGDFLYVKADSADILTTLQQTKVLEISTQERNFLEETPTSELKQLGGVYFRIKPQGFRISEDDFEFYEFSGYDSSRNKYDNPIRNDQTYVEDIITYGLSTSDDVVNSGTYIGSNDIRYLIEIDSVGTPDTFRWSNDNGVTFVQENVAITGAAQVLENGLEITFGKTTGYDIDDYWILSAKAAGDNDFGGAENSRAYGIFKSIGEGDTAGDVDIIEGGARITIIYDEYGDLVNYIEKTYISSRRYANLEEWWYGDNINNDFGIPDTRIWFRRGSVGNDGNAKFIDIDPTKEMSMIIRSEGEQNSDLDDRAKISSYISIFQSENNIIFESKPLETNSDIFFEVGKTYDISPEGYHLGSEVSDIDQGANNPAILTLPFFNAFCWGNGFESFKIRDVLTGNRMGIDTRASAPIEDYRENRRISSVTYSGVFEQTSNFNGLNEFNLSLVNYKDLDDKYGKIRKIYGRDTNLLVFQEDKVHQVLFNKSIIFNADGSGNVSQNQNVLGQEVPYAGEYGISDHPESFAIFGNNIWWTDVKRGAVLRLGAQGITEVSTNGMQDFFRDDFRENANSKKLGAYDPYFDQYTLYSETDTKEKTVVVNCDDIIFKTLQTSAFNYTFKLNSLDGNITLNYNVSSGTANISAEFDGNTYFTGPVSGAGNLVFPRTSSELDEVNVIVTPVSLSVEYSIGHSCPVGTPLEVISIIINDTDDTGKTMTSRYKWNNSPFYSEIPVFEEDGITLFKSEIGAQGVGRFPIEGANIEMQAYKDYTNSGNFIEDATNSLSYLVTDVTYTEADIATIRALSTPLAITTINGGSVPETNKGNFTFTRPVGNEKLYLIWNYVSLAINRDTYIYIYFDSSGSMNSTLAPLQVMRDTLLKDALLPFYDNDETLYDNRVVVIEQADERTIDMLNINGNTPVGNVVSLVFQDEAEPIYHTSPYDGVRTATYDSDLSVFRARLDGFDPTYYRGVMFQVEPNSGTNFKDFIQEVQTGTGNFSGTNGLSDKTEILYRYDIQDGGTPQYYLDQVTTALEDLGFDLDPNN